MLNWKQQAEWIHYHRREVNKEIKLWKRTQKKRPEVSPEVAQKQRSELIPHRCTRFDMICKKELGVSKHAEYTDIRRFQMCYYFIAAHA
eukprot:338710-Prorocentrum_lima.AAC.1